MSTKHQQYIKRKKKKCLIKSFPPPGHGMLSDPWDLSRLEPQGWTGVGWTQLGKLTFTETPLKPVLSSLSELGPKTLVHNDHAGVTLWPPGPGKVTKYPGRLVLGSPGEASFLRVAAYEALQQGDVPQVLRSSERRLKLQGGDSHRNLCLYKVIHKGYLQPSFLASFIFSFLLCTYTEVYLSPTYT